MGTMNTNIGFGLKTSRYLQIVVLTAVIGSILTVLTVYPSDSQSTKTGTTSSVPTDFKTVPLEDLNGNKVYVKDFKGKVVVLEFMATWCITCAQQVPILKDFASKYKSANVVLVSVTVDPGFDTPDVLRNYVVKKELNYLVTRDTTLGLTDYFKVNELSTIVIISPDGEVKETFKGLTDLDTLSKAVDQFL